MTPRTLSFPALPRVVTSPRNIVAWIGRWLLEADARARDRRHLEDLPDRLRADAGLPPRSNTERAMRDLFLRTALTRSGWTGAGI